MTNTNQSEQGNKGNSSLLKRAVGAVALGGVMLVSFARPNQLGTETRKEMQKADIPAVSRIKPFPYKIEAPVMRINLEALSGQVRYSRQDAPPTIVPPGYLTASKSKE